MNSLVLASSGGLFALGAIFLLILLVGLACFVFWVWTIIDAAKRPEQQWVAANQNKALWLILLIVVGIFGPGLIVSVAYVFWPRPRLKAAEAGAIGCQDGGYTNGGGYPGSAF